MIKSEKEYKEHQKKNQAKEKEIEQLGEKLEPYWDSKTKKLKPDAPEEIKKDYERFLQLFEELTTDI